MRTKPSRNQLSIKQLLLKFLAVLTLGTVIFMIASMALVGIYQIWYAGKIFPGITINGIGIGGMTIDDASIHLISNFSLIPSGNISLWYEDARIEATPQQLGISLDWQSSINEAYSFGRKGSIAAWFAYQLSGNFAEHDIKPTIIFDQSVAASALTQISRQFDQPVVEASILMQGTQVSTEPGQAGKELNVSASLDQINIQIQEMNLQQIVLPITETTPQIMDASPYAAQAQEILNRSLTLYLPGETENTNTVWQIKAEELAPMLTFEKLQQDGQISLIPQLKEDYLNAFLEELAQQIEIQTQNPRFIFNDSTGKLDLLEPGTQGRLIDHEATKVNLQEALAQGQTSAAVATLVQQPEVSDTASGADLGITELVHSESSYFYGSSEARIQNIKMAASQFHGLLVPPNSTFSMAAAMDEITLDNGYAEALIIYNGQTIEGVGGGVCQVSTTLFRAAFFSGFQITERHPHAYRVSYYEKTSGNQRNSNLAGLDATVYVPIIDLKFTNDTPYWLLMETYVDESSKRITWKFYSTWDGRSVDWDTTGPTDIEKPEEPLYKENPELEKGEIEQVEWEADGADVLVNRTVYRNDSFLFNDAFETHYEPWRAVYEYGPGTSGIPEPEEEKDENGD